MSGSFCTSITTSVNFCVLQKVYMSSLHSDARQMSGSPASHPRKKGKASTSPFSVTVSSRSGSGDRGRPGSR